MSDIDNTLQKRASDYGDSFLEQCAYSQGIKEIMRKSPQWDKMQTDQKEAMEMIATKLSRLLYGNCNHIDSWHDIIGYARLVETRLNPPTILTSKE